MQLEMDNNRDDTKILRTVERKPARATYDQNKIYSRDNKIGRIQTDTMGDRYLIDPLRHTILRQRCKLETAHTIRGR